MYSSIYTEIHGSISTDTDTPCSPPLIRRQLFVTMVFAKKERKKSHRYVSLVRAILNWQQQRQISHASFSLTLSLSLSVLSLIRSFWSCLCSKRKAPNSQRWITSHFSDFALRKHSNSLASRCVSLCLFRVHTKFISFSCRHLSIYFHCLTSIKPARKKKRQTNGTTEAAACAKERNAKHELQKLSEKNTWGKKKEEIK